MPSTNTLTNTTKVLDEALLHLDNALVMGKLVNRDYESEFAKPMKGGDTIYIRRPIRGTVRSGATYSAQDNIEGKFGLTVATQIGADIDMTSVDLTMKVEDFGERYLKPRMIRLANEIDLSCHSELYKNTWNWVGTPGQVINSHSDYAKGPKRLDQLAVPTDSRAGVMDPDDYWDTVSSISGLYIQNKANTALEEAKLGRFARTDTYMSQNIKKHTVGALGGTPLVNGGSQTSTYTDVKDTNQQTLNIDGATNSVTGWAKQGDVFTIAGVFAVNPVTKETQAFLQQFVVKADANSNGSGAVALTISPAIITSGAYQTVSAAPADNAAITWLGSASTAYPQNLVFHPDALTLAVVPLIKPDGAVRCEQRSYKGINMRLITGYDINNDLSMWRFDILYGVKALMPELACRVSGTA